MKTKNIDWLQDKIQEIKTKKRKLKNLKDPDMVKKIKKDLNIEYRSSKRVEKNNLKKWLKEEKWNDCN